MEEYPAVTDPGKVGEYPGIVKSGGGYVWDEVLEYCVWCHPHAGAPDIENGDDYYYTFDNYAEAFDFAQNNDGCEEPLTLILQREYINEPEPGVYVHMKEERLTEWPVAFLKRPRQTDKTIPDFLTPDAPANRLDILRGLV